MYFLEDDFYEVPGTLSFVLLHDDPYIIDAICDQLILSDEEGDLAPLEAEFYLVSTGDLSAELN